MTAWQDLPLSATTQDVLRQLQARLDEAGDYKAQVAKAQSLWDNKTGTIARKAAFDEVRRVLETMCTGRKRCAYCEGSCADAVEHFQPKSLYPELAFLWENFLYVCSICNGTKYKGSKWAVCPAGAVTLVDVTRAQNTPIVPPPPGENVLLNPRRENPMDFLVLDVRDTFFYYPIASQGSRECLRAEYTIKLLGLNERDDLVAGRRDVYTSHCNTLRACVRLRDTNASAAEVESQRDALLGLPHRAVWEEMKRRKYPADLFAKLPEVLAWV
jgi:hypothetical protein